MQTLGIHLKHRPQARQKEGDPDNEVDTDAEAAQHALSQDGNLNLTKSQHYQHVCKLMADLDRLVIGEPRLPTDLLAHAHTLSVIKLRKTKIS